MSNIKDNLLQIKSSLPGHVRMVAVSKLHPVSELIEAYEAGQRIFGENKVQELLLKQEAMPKDIQWHLIGHLQTNKVKYVVPFASLIHGIDSLKLLKEVDKQANKIDKTVDCLLQIHIAQEESKFGFSDDEVKEVLSNNGFEELGNVRIRGLMGMATFTENEDQVRKEFKGLKQLFNELKATFFVDNTEFDILSMGMSNDYKIAIEEGSTMVRIGSSIFGERNYQ
ncbi:MAG: YggS family pyridoxal phosphate-dependent enzyme [Prevotellaceae bacterium]|jgi:pyridoxal phosphate enzyme (YggS family)|nr:YggS family pyridoxal phosphate-dependent enzyme [Prevotellaceae bacterium]